MNSEEKTKEKIISMAIMQIKETGFEEVSLRNLAKQIGLTTGAFYKHFKNKDDLWRTVTIKISNEITQEVKAKISTEQGCKQQLLVLAELLLNKFLDEANLMNFLFFNPVALQVFKQRNEEFQLLNLTIMLIKDLLKEKNKKIEVLEFFTQIWSFIQGYGLLINKEIVNYDAKLVERTLSAFLKE